jgi:hypothetical protein
MASVLQLLLLLLRGCLKHVVVLFSLCLTASVLICAHPLCASSKCEDCPAGWHQHTSSVLLCAMSVLIADFMLK